MQAWKLFVPLLTANGWAFYNTISDKNNDYEFVAQAIGTGTWRDWIKKIPKPVFALGKNDMYSVLVQGTDFKLPIGITDEPAIGFYTSRFVAAENVHAAKIAARNSVLNEWSTKGFLKVSGSDPKISIEEIDLLYERFRLRSGGGFSFYCNDDPE